MCRNDLASSIVSSSRVHRSKVRGLAMAGHPRVDPGIRTRKSSASPKEDTAFHVTRLLSSLVGGDGDAHSLVAVREEVAVHVDGDGDELALGVSAAGLEGAGTADDEEGDLIAALAARVCGA